jgi:hypothetical protein
MILFFAIGVIGWRGHAGGTTGMPTPADKNLRANPAYRRQAWHPLNPPGCLIGQAHPMLF